MSRRRGPTPCVALGRRMIGRCGSRALGVRPRHLKASGAEAGWRRFVPAVVGVVGLAVVGVLALLCWLVADHTGAAADAADRPGGRSARGCGHPDRGAVGDHVDAMRATTGTPRCWRRWVPRCLPPRPPVPQRRAVRVDSTTPVGRVGEPSASASRPPDEITASDRAARATPMAIVDLLDQQRTLGFAVVDDPAAPRYVLYAERRLSPDPNVRRRSEEPFSQPRCDLLDAETDAQLLDRANVICR